MRRKDDGESDRDETNDADDTDNEDDDISYLLSIELQEEIVFLLLRSLAMHEKVKEQTGEEDCGDEIEGGIDPGRGGRLRRLVWIGGRLRRAG